MQNGTSGNESSSFAYVTMMTSKSLVQELSDFFDVFFPTFPIGNVKRFSL